jgi:tyrosinase
MPVTPGVRRALTEIQAEYDSGDKEALETLMRAWKGIKDLPADDPRSFFMLGGYHGEPFRDQGATDPAWWGGYCEHGTVLFPTWHRAYLYVLEKALESIPGCAGVMLPFWDETSPDFARERPAGRADVGHVRARRSGHPQSAAVLCPAGRDRRRRQGR